jgi:hypothetical protein
MLQLRARLLKTLSHEWPDALSSSALFERCAGSPSTSRQLLAELADDSYVERLEVCQPYHRDREGGA